MVPRTHRHGPRPSGLAVAAGASAFLLFAAFGTMVAAAALVLGVTMPIVLAVAAVVLLQRRALRRRRWQQPHYPRAFAPPSRRPYPPLYLSPYLSPYLSQYRQVPVAPAAPPVGVQWASARQRFDELRTEYAGYECDPLLVLRLPALADVRVSSTGRFVEAFAAAQALDTDTEPPAKHASDFVAAVDRACRAWRAAWDAAERIRLSGLSADERAAVERVVKLLTVARDTDSDAERLTAYAKARTELARLERTGAVRLPTPAQAALDAAYRGQLTWGEPA